MRRRRKQRRAHRRFRTDVALDGDRATAESGNLGDGFGCLRLRSEVRDGDISACMRQGERYGSAMRRAPPVTKTDLPARG